MKISKCLCCGKQSFKQVNVLWTGLINQWKLTPAEVRYINRQQGYVCTSCGSNLRSITLAYAIMQCFDFPGIFKDFVKTNKHLKILEINEAGHLSQFLCQMPGHYLATYPDIDMKKMPYQPNQFDLIVHSDTLEHVDHPTKALEEVYRILRPGGHTCYTVPVIMDRLTKRRSSRSKSYHGTPGGKEYLVYTEYGADSWRQLVESGFNHVSIYSIDFPASIALSGKKPSSLTKSRSISQLFKYKFAR